MKECPICKGVAGKELDELERDVYVIHCDNCGAFFITEEALEVIEHNVKKRLQIMALLRERHINEYGRIAIYEEKPSEKAYKNFPVLTIDELLSTFPKDLFEKFDRILLNFSKSVKYPSDKIYISKNDGSLFFVESDDSKEFIGMIKYMVDSGLLSGHVGYPSQLEITIKGWERISEIVTSHDNKDQVFVAMWFNDEMDSPYTNAISKAIEDNGYNPIRIDKVEHNNKIDDEIIANIKKSKFVVADFTGHRGGVYFEAGYAMGLGLPIIWTCRGDHLQELHFDTRQYSHLVWETEDELYTLLDNRIKATIK